MGAAFDDALIEAVAVVTSTEARAFNNVNQSGLDYWTPNINPYRDVSRLLSRSTISVSKS